MANRIPANEGMLYYLIEKIRPDIAEHISTTGIIETVVIGLGSQGTRHAGIMQEFGTTVVAGIAPGKGGLRIHETIPVYDTISECLEEHPFIAAASIWRHYSTARDATIEAIDAGIPIVVLISEGVPLKDARDIIVHARQKNTFLFGGNTPGIIFPPEGIKIGMLPDVFYPAEKEPDRFSPEGVTIISRSGAILYHMSDGLASRGIAQNAVIGVGGDAITGAPFSKIVPIVSAYKHTDLVVVAGEIGGCQEELLAQDIKEHPEKYPKPIVALISGAHAPVGKTMGHAGAIVAPGQNYGTFLSKKAALEGVGVKVVNSQHDLIDAVSSRLKGRTYFQVSRYYEKMKKTWEVRPSKPSWGTLITKIEPNSIIIAGYSLNELIGKISLLEASYLLVKGELPDKKIIAPLNNIALEAFKQGAPKVYYNSKEDISKFLEKALLNDPLVADFPCEGKNWQVNKTVFTLGRMIKYLSLVFSKDRPILSSSECSIAELIYFALSNKKEIDLKQAKMLEAIAVASVDHGVTPPSTQATLIAASTRASYEVAVGHGVGVITDVHGGAGGKAAEFFKKCLLKAKEEHLDKKRAVAAMISEYIKEGKRIEGLGHRVHTEDPRRDVLWNIASECGVSGECVELSKMVTEIFESIRGIHLPINVDGVIGAIVADMMLPFAVAKALFILGRVAGLSAHYFEEIISQPPMRRINFSEAVYKGKDLRKLGKI